MTPRKMILRCLAAAVASGGAMTVFPAFASDGSIETIVVTAQARVQTAEEVPITMQVVTMDQILDLGAANLSDMNGYFPGFTVSGDQPTQPNFALRGIGTGDFGISTDAPVGVYVDGVYTGKTGGALMNFNDIQRVEVLKGPQGTLFGRNSAAGAIAIYTNEPSRKTEASGHLRLGRFGTRYYDGVANTPLTDSTAVRFSFVNNHSDGWVTNETTGKKAGGDNAWGSRLAFKWAAGDSEATLSWDHEDLDQGARPAFGVVKVAAGTAPVFPPDASTFVNPFKANLENDAPNRETRKFDGLTLRFETLLSDLTFNSLTAYRHFKSFNREDNDGTANPATYLDTANAEKNTSWQQEFKLSHDGDNLDWVGGVSFFYSKATQQSDVNTNTDSLDTLLPTLFGAGATPFIYASGVLGQNLYGNSWTEKMENTGTAKAQSIFGDVIWHLTSDTNLTTGLRWTHDVKSASWYVPVRAAPGLDAIDVSSAVTALNTLSAGLGDILLAPNLIFLDSAASASTKTTASHSWTDLSPRVVIDHRLSPDSLLFGSISRGYQAGGFNVFSPQGRFDPEHMTNFEMGLKNYFPDKGLTLNGSVFHYLFTNLQDITLVSVNGGVPVYDVTTSGESATGIDLDAALKLSDSVKLFAATEFINQRYDKKTFTSHLTRQEVSLKDQPVGTPMWTSMGGVNVTWDVLTGHAEFNLQGTYTSKERCNAQTSEDFGCLNDGPARTGKPMTRVDLKLGWETADRRFGTALLVNNLFDKRYLLSSSSSQSAFGGSQSLWTFGTPYATLTPPRFIGVEFKAAL